MENEPESFENTNWRYKNLQLSKKETFKIAQELMYPHSILIKILEAETIADIENIMRFARENYL